MFRSVERARETRLWLTQIVLPVAIAAVYICTRPETKKKFNDWKNQHRFNDVDDN